MRVFRNSEYDAAYVQLVPMRRNEVKMTIMVNAQSHLMLDFDEFRHLIGIDLAGASRCCRPRCSRKPSRPGTSSTRSGPDALL